MLAIAQAALGLRVLLRLLRTAHGRRIPVAPPEQSAPAGSVSVIVPTLNEERRLGPCLAGLLAQGAEVGEILVADGGSTDGTRPLVERFARRDPRLRPVDAGPAPAETNGKVHNLEAAFRRGDPDATWILTVDADVRPEPALVRSLLAFARREGLGALSVATEQRLSGSAEGLLHPALLATLVYRFGIPGHATADVAAVQANGQCFLLRRDLLRAAGGFAPLAGSLCEDVTLARTLAAAGHPVGFFEGAGLVSVAGYDGWREAWDGWSRSLPMRDRFWGARGWLGLLEVTFAQALPLPLALLLAATRTGHDPAWKPLLRLNALLAAVRLGVLVGSSRAYARRPVTVWLSPVSDLPVAGKLWLSAARRRHRWRDRSIVRGGSA